MNRERERKGKRGAYVWRNGSVRKPEIHREKKEPIEEVGKIVRWKCLMYFDVIQKLKSVELMFIKRNVPCAAENKNFSTKSLTKRAPKRFGMIRPKGKTLM